jgi:hypothetical protein
MKAALSKQLLDRLVAGLRTSAGKPALTRFVGKGG